MIDDKAAPIVVEIARNFVHLLQGISPDWRKAFLRFESRDSVAEIKGSFIHELGVNIIDVTKHKDFFHPMSKKGMELLNSLGKNSGVFLVIVNSNFDYEIKFEYHDMNRWKISKLDGGTGIPIGIDS